MRAATQPKFPELELAITRFLEDFQSIIREHVQRALRKTKVPRKRALPVTAPQGASKGARAAKRKPTRGRAKASRPEQLTLF